MPILEVKNIKKGFGDTDVLKGVSFSMERGQVLAIIGSSGSGKTTLLRCLNFLETPDEGEIWVNGKLLTGENLSDDQIRQNRLHFGLVFQNFNLFPHYTVMKNVTDAPVCVQKRDKNEVEKEAKELLKKVGLDGKENSYPCQLSGGQQQRAGIARAFISRPEIVFADEPTGNLDSKTTKEVMEMIRRFARTFHQTIVLVSHDPEMTTYADRIVTLIDGQIVSDERTDNGLQAAESDNNKQ